MLALDDTICAIATPPGEGGLGLVRISGPRAFQVADLVFAGPARTLSSFASHTIHHGVLRDAATGEVIDDVLALVFRSPRSYTGEDVVEFSCHGGPVTLGRALSLAVGAGARLAEPGEFTRRAFRNGRMDLAQAEAVCDLIRARTESAQRVALAQQQGSLTREVARLRDVVVGAAAAVEASTDFTDEVGELDASVMEATLLTALSSVDRLLATAARGRAYREGIRLAIVGRPNVGKSSLLNALLGRDRAIVTPIAGTTRDVVEASASIRGIPVLAADTAGLRPSDDPVERIGVERALDALQAASLVLFVTDASEVWQLDDEFAAGHLPGGRVIWVANKVDLLGAEALRAAKQFLQARAGAAPKAWVSARTGDGIDHLEGAIAQAAAGDAPDAPEGAVVSNVRHAEALRATRMALVHARATLAQRLPADLLAVDLRAALNGLGLITGQTATEDVIDRIFRDFCVGK